MYRFGPNPKLSLLFASVTFVLGLGILMDGSIFGVVAIFLGSVVLWLVLRLRVKVTSEAVLIRNAFGKCEARFDDPDVCFVLPGLKPAWHVGSHCLRVEISDEKPIFAWATLVAGSSGPSSRCQMWELQEQITANVKSATIRTLPQAGDPY